MKANTTPPQVAVPRSMPPEADESAAVTGEMPEPATEQGGRMSTNNGIGALDAAVEIALGDAYNSARSAAVLLTNTASAVIDEGGVEDGAGPFCPVTAEQVEAVEELARETFRKLEAQLDAPPLAGLLIATVDLRNLLSLFAAIALLARAFNVTDQVQRTDVFRRPVIADALLHFSMEAKAVSKPDHIDRAFAAYLRHDRATTQTQGGAA